MRREEKKENAKQSLQNSEGITVKNTKLAIINAFRKLKSIYKMLIACNKQYDIDFG